MHLYEKICFMFRCNKVNKAGMRILSTILGIFLIIASTGCSSGGNKSANSADNSATKESSSKSSESSDKNLKVHFIDVGQADSILIQQGNNSMLIDAGNNDDSQTVKNYIDKLGIKKLDYVIGTHPHEDHIGGLDYVIDNFQIGSIYMPKATSNTKTYKDVINSIKKKNMQITAPKPGDSFKLGEAECKIFAPNSDSYEDVNDYSIVIKLTFGENTFLFDGDAEATSEKEIVSKNYDIKADVLKVGHHGSGTSTSDEFLKKVSPKYAVISVGKDNDYGHPHKQTMDRLSKSKIPTYRTDESGTVICTSDGKNISFNTSPGTYKYPKSK